MPLFFFYEAAFYATHHVYEAKNYNPTSTVYKITYYTQLVTESKLN